MVRKVQLHVDALAVIVVLVAAAVGFIAFQKYQYSDLLQENLSRQWKQLELEYEVARLEALVKRCVPLAPPGRS